VLVTSEPKEFNEFRDTIKPRAARVFFGALNPSKLGLSQRTFRRIPAGRRLLPEGDFRDWTVVEAWADSIALELERVTVPPAATTRDHSSESLACHRQRCARIRRDRGAERRRLIARSAPAPEPLYREIVVSELDDLVSGEVIDVRANVGDNLCRHVLVMLLRIGDPLVRRICLPVPVAQQ
jgi:hypothetical protein